MVADALNRKERIKPLRVRALSVTIESGVRQQIIEAQTETFKEENISNETLRGLEKQFEPRENGGFYFVDRIWVLLI